MGYIEELRSLVGHAPLILNSAGAIILNDKGKVLLEYRKDTNNWGLPGGYMELGESFEDTVKRELEEEMGMQVRNLTFFNIFSGHNYYHEYPNGDKVYSVIAIYIADAPIEEMTPDNKEISHIQYFSLKELPHNLTKVSKQILHQYKNEKNTQSQNH